LLNSASKDWVEKYYDQEASDYIHMYEKNYLQYPANAIRLDMISRRLRENDSKSVLDAGCGTCGPLIRFLKEGMIAKGFDISEKMVEEGKKELQKEGYDPNLIFTADLEKGENLPLENFDAAVALGIFPHIPNEKQALNNLKKTLKKNGKVFIEFRNDLFSLYTLNTYSNEFFINRLLNVSLLPDELKEEVFNFYQKKV